MKPEISAVIVDDEIHARTALKRALQSYPHITLLGECEQGRQAVKLIAQRRPQLIFLDVQMPQLDGFDVLELLGEETPLTVFVTAYDEYALRAFDSNAVDYLLKPVDPNRLQQTIHRVEQRLQAGMPHSYAPLLAVHNRQQAPLQRLLLREGDETHIVPVSDVIYFEAAGDYVAVHLAGKTYIKQERLRNLENRLDSARFCRIHRSCLLNMRYLATLEMVEKGNRIAVLENGVRLPVSRSGYIRLKAWL